MKFVPYFAAVAVMSALSVVTAGCEGGSKPSRLCYDEAGARGTCVDIAGTYRVDVAATVTSAEGSEERSYVGIPLSVAQDGPAVRWFGFLGVADDDSVSIDYTISSTLFGTWEYWFKQVSYGEVYPDSADVTADVWIYAGTEVLDQYSVRYVVSNVVKDPPPEVSDGS